MATCLICLEDVALVTVSTCAHAACAICLKKWLGGEEASGIAHPRCPMLVCGSIMQNEAVLWVLGREFQVRNARASEDKNSTLDSIDKETEQWLERETKMCGGCGARVSKSEGCDKMQCLCGWRFCWNCDSIGAKCDCNKGHGFFDNILRRPTFADSARIATEEQARDLQSFILEQLAASGEENAIQERTRIDQVYR